LIYPTTIQRKEPTARQTQTTARVKDDRREDDQAPDVRRASRNEDPVRSGAKHRET